MTDFLRDNDIDYPASLAGGSSDLKEELGTDHNLPVETSRLAAMQPYFFPYLGYFQLANAVDQFVFLDDVSFIKRGWINRNRILVNGEGKYLTIPCFNPSQNRLINEIEHRLDGKGKRKLLLTIRHAYGKAPFFTEVMTLIEQVLDTDSPYIQNLAERSVEVCARYLGIECRFYRNSVTNGNSQLKAQERIIDICCKAGAQVYINPAGGKKLYNKSDFRDQGIDLRFIKPKPVEYNQFGDKHIPWLSIIDVLMFNGRRNSADLLEAYHLEQA
ncbi:WbqC family protein [Balneolales bacterium ANBcel1]|nr:WbqC family protein [Balneolales bacterium ANBcel1]